MRLLQRILIAGVTVMAISAGAAMAHGYNGSTITMIDPASQNYNGSYPVTVSRSQHSNGTYCLTLNETARNGGSASVVLGSQRLSGSFQILNHTLVATIEAQGYGQNAGLVFIGSARRGNIDPGVYDEVYGGSPFDEGALAFGTKGGC